MAIELNNLVSTMVDAGRTMTGDIWEQIETFAVPELRKIGIQIQAIVDNAADFSPEGARALFDMQVKASIGVIVAMTTMTLLAVQNAINAVIAAVRGMVNGALPFPLL